MGRGQQVDRQRPPPSSPSPAADGRSGRRQSSARRVGAPRAPRPPRPAGHPVRGAGERMATSASPLRSLTCRAPELQLACSGRRILPLLPLPMADPRAAAVDGAASAALPCPEQGQPGGAGSSSSALPAAPSAPSSARIRPRLKLPGDASRLGSGGQRSGSVLAGERERADGWARFLQGQRSPFLCCDVLETKT